MVKNSKLVAMFLKQYKLFSPSGNKSHNTTTRCIWVFWYKLYSHVGASNKLVLKKTARCQRVKLWGVSGNGGHDWVQSCWSAAAERARWARWNVPVPEISYKQCAEYYTKTAKALSHASGQIWNNFVFILST